MTTLTKVFLSLCLLTLVLSNCSKKESPAIFDRSKEMRNVDLKTMHDVLFEGKLNFENQLTQFSNQEGFLRSVTPIESNGDKTGYFRYRITEAHAGANG